MIWTEALALMKQGYWVRRGPKKTTFVGMANGMAVYDGGSEPICLAAAWSVDNHPVVVFQGAESLCLFVPDDQDFNATDWRHADDTAS